MIASGLSSIPTSSVWGCFNAIQLISMQAYTDSEMPSNAANMFRSIDTFMRGDVLNPGKRFKQFFTDEQPTSLRKLQDVPLQD
jgi:hypothetical protein